jgi:hypothetical protein
MQQLTTKIVRQWWVPLLLGGFMFVGCGYGEVTPRCYDYAKALYSICNRRDAQRLEKFAALVEADQQAGELGKQEADWLRDIAERARTGEWSDAQAAARQLLEDQVRSR